VEISTNGGSSWTQITPAGGYPYTIRDNPESPFSAGTPCFSGNHDWMLATFDLSSFSGAVNIRFRFGSDGYTTAEGWYIDDVAVYSNNPRLTLTVSETPAYVSPGELATWKVTISNLGNQTVADFWLEISPVIGYDAGYKFLLKEDFNIPKGYSGTSALKFKVPTSAKFGNFRVKNVIGQYPGSVYASDSFDVTVQ
jgi:hypothetical protein